MVWGRANKCGRFGVDFDPRVVRADGNVRKLAWRIRNARKVLVSFTRIADNAEEEVVDEE